MIDPKYDWRLACLLCDATENIILVPQVIGEKQKLSGYLAVCDACYSTFNGADIFPRTKEKEECDGSN